VAGTVVVVTGGLVVVVMGGLVVVVTGGLVVAVTGGLVVPAWAGAVVVVPAPPFEIGAVVLVVDAGGDCVVVVALSRAARDVSAGFEAFGGNVPDELGVVVVDTGGSEPGGRDDALSEPSETVGGDVLNVRTATRPTTVEAMTIGARFMDGSLS